LARILRTGFFSIVLIVVVNMVEMDLQRFIETDWEVRSDLGVEIIATRVFVHNKKVCASVFAREASSGRSEPASLLSIFRDVPFIP
jgi:hypothetical protein